MKYSLFKHRGIRNTFGINEVSLLNFLDWILGFVILNIFFIIFIKDELRYFTLLTLYRF